MNHAKRNPGIPKRPNPQKNAKVVLVQLLDIEENIRDLLPERERRESVEV
jgi:hypothetical protein